MFDTTRIMARSCHRRDLDIKGIPETMKQNLCYCQMAILSCVFETSALLYRTVDLMRPGHLLVVSGLCECVWGDVWESLRGGKWI